MKLKKISIVTCFLLQITLLTSCATTDGSASRAEARVNAAAEYAMELRAFVTGAARTCKNLLERDDAFEDDIVEDWQLNNGDYVYAGSLWIAIGVVKTAQQAEEEFGSENGPAIRERMLMEKLEIFSAVGTKMVDGVLSGSRTEQLKICNGFPDEIRAGRYDITSESEHYLMLTILVERLGKQ